MRAGGQQVANLAEHLAVTNTPEQLHTGQENSAKDSWKENRAVSAANAANASSLFPSHHPAVHAYAATAGAEDWQPIETLRFCRVEDMDRCLLDISDLGVRSITPGTYLQLALGYVSHNTCFLSFTCMSEHYQIPYCTACSACSARFSWCDESMCFFSGMLCCSFLTDRTVRFPLHCNSLHHSSHYDTTDLPRLLNPATAYAVVLRMAHNLWRSSAIKKEQHHEEDGVLKKQLREDEAFWSAVHKSFKYRLEQADRSYCTS